MQRRNRDIEKTYSKHQFVEKIRRLANSLEKDENFTIQIKGERIRVPSSAIVNIEHERGGGQEEIEFQIKW